MIEPRELRENNLYKVKENTYKCVGHYYDHGQKYVELIEIDEEDFNMFKARHISKLKPIPLTEEILFKCGFEWVKRFECYVHCYKTEKEFILQKEYDFWLMCDINLKVQIKHLHQLQNLYHSLTGKEIKI